MLVAARERRHVMVYRPMLSAKKKLRRISEPNRLPEIIKGIKFRDGNKQFGIAA